MFKLHADERLTRWRDFRKSLSSTDLGSAVASVAKFWEPCPFNPYYLDPSAPAAWPDPWTLIAENWYCDLAKALGMLYTIKYTTHNPSVEIHSYRDPATGYDYNLVWINDGEYILNLYGNDIAVPSDINPTWKCTRKFLAADLKLDNY